ncbi:hypothetical protein HYR99_08880 [Candidatus Poribacteria bacterium]|nr:hypothetical protein [Candidatus Poribacteria bacterium]
MTTLKLTVDQILTAIDLLDKPEKEQLERGLEEREWQRLYQDDAFVALMRKRISEASREKAEDRLISLDELQAELEEEGILP